MSIFLVGFFVVGCRPATKKVSENDIQFDSIIVDKTYHLSENRDNPNCNLQIKLVYPVKAANKELLKLIQQQFVLSFFGEQYDTLTPEKAVDRYVEEYLANYKSLEDDFKAEVEAEAEDGDEEDGHSWFSYYETSANEIVYNSNNLISYAISIERYTGGAHGAHAFLYRVIQLKNGAPVTEEDIFIDDFQDELAQLLVDKIAAQNGIKEAKELETIGFFSVEEIFPNGNFLIDDDGITYCFNEYEIAAYVVGATKVHLPYREIRHLLREESPITQFIDN
ncbi:MAG: DUF3298 and DUF4163 domain-containing protein [Tannerellaceae bacterium]|nr:DUF3298 and DUF4163 domain-containing protein [Tannerellaceae bacterium]